jgi:hypothetical protein
MGTLTRATDASIDTSTAQFAPQITGLLAGEDLDVAAPCCVKTADGLVYMSDGDAADEVANVMGFTARAVKSGQPVTLFGLGTRFRYGTGLTKAALLYVSATNGRLDDAGTTGDAVGCAYVLTATDIVVCRANGKHAA